MKHRATETKMALKLCSMMRIGRGRILTDEMAKTAMSDFKHAPSKFDGPEVEAILKLFRAERLVLRCPSDLCPFVMDINEQSTHQCIYNDVDGELGFPMRPGVGDLFAVWSELNDQVKEKDSRLVTDDVRNLLVSWASQMADGLFFLHKCRIFHSNIHLKNYVMGNDG